MAYNVVTEAEASQMATLYATGLSSNDVGKHLGRDGRLVRTQELTVAHSRGMAAWLYERSTSATRCERKYEKAIGRIGAQ